MISRISLIVALGLMVSGCGLSGLQIASGLLGAVPPNNEPYHWHMPSWLVSPEVASSDKAHVDMNYITRP